MAAPEPLLRIGEVARRAGIAPATLRAWERRYSIVEPTRTESGYRLYSEADERKLRKMRMLIEDGVAPAEAARRLAESTPSQERADPLQLDRLHSDLHEALLDFDVRRSGELLDLAMDGRDPVAFVEQVAIPVLREIGSGWERGEVSVAQEHFASNLVRARLSALAGPWGQGSGPRALLACPPGERHDLGLMGFGIALNDLGWRIIFLGADSPHESILGAAASAKPDWIVIGLTRPPGINLPPEFTEQLAEHAPVAIGGRGTSRELAEELGVELVGKTVSEAARALVKAGSPG